MIFLCWLPLPLCTVGNSVGFERPFLLGVGCLVYVFMPFTLQCVFSASEFYDVVSYLLAAYCH